MPIVLFLFLALSIILESSLFTFPLTLLLVIAYFLSMQEQAFLMVFLAGIIMDLFTHRPFGIDSLIFLLVCLVVSRYQKKIYTMNIFYLVVFVAGVIGGYDYLFYRQIIMLHFILGIAVFYLLLWLISKFFPTMIVYNKKLTV